jgi:hypothetical protein
MPTPFDRQDRDQAHPEVEALPSSGSLTMLGQAGANVGAGVVQRKLAQRRLQRKAADTASSEGGLVQQAAEEGIAGAGGPLPHLAAIQRSFGRHDVSGVEGHVGGRAETGSRAMGAEAYASGNHVAFAGAPDLHTAAHEAAHVVQQQGGVHLKGGVGEEGDAYERHADAVADGVVQGKSVEGLLDEHAPSVVGEAGSARSAVQRRLTVGSGTNHVRSFGKYIELVDYLDDAEKMVPADKRPWWDQWKALINNRDEQIQSSRDAAIVDSVEGTWSVDEKMAHTLGVPEDAKGAASCYWAAFLMITAAMDDIATQNPDTCKDDAVMKVKQRATGWDATVQKCKATGDRLEEQLTARGVQSTVKWDFGWTLLNEVIARQIYLSAMTKLVDEAGTDATVAKIIAPMMNKEFNVKVLANSALDEKYTVSGQAFSEAVHLGAGIAQQTAVTMCHDAETTKTLMAERIPEVKRLILHEMTHVIQIQKYTAPGIPIENDDPSEKEQITRAVAEMRSVKTISSRIQSPLTDAQVTAAKSISAKFGEHPGTASAEVLSHLIEVRDAWGGGTAADALIAEYLPSCNVVYRRVLH